MKTGKTVIEMNSLASYGKSRRTLELMTYMAATMFSPMSQCFLKTKLKIVSSFKTTEVVGKYYKQQVNKTLMIQASEVPAGTVLFRNLSELSFSLVF